MTSIAGGRLTVAVVSVGSTVARRAVRWLVVAAVPTIGFVSWSSAIATVALVVPTIGSISVAVGNSGNGSQCESLKHRFLLLSTGNKSVGLFKRKFPVVQMMPIFKINDVS